MKAAWALVNRCVDDRRLWRQGACALALVASLTAHAEPLRGLSGPSFFSNVQRCITKAARGLVTGKPSLEQTIKNLESTPATAENGFTKPWLPATAESPLVQTARAATDLQKLDGKLLVVELTNGKRFLGRLDSKNIQAQVLRQLDQNPIELHPHSAKPVAGTQRAPTHIKYSELFSPNAKIDEVSKLAPTGAFRPFSGGAPGIESPTDAIPHEDNPMSRGLKHYAKTKIPIHVQLKDGAFSTGTRMLGNTENVIPVDTGPEIQLFQFPAGAHPDQAPGPQARRLTVSSPNALAESTVTQAGWSSLSGSNDLGAFTKELLKKQNAYVRIKLPNSAEPHVGILDSGSLAKTNLDNITVTVIGTNGQHNKIPWKDLKNASVRALDAPTPKHPEAKGKLDIKG